MCALVCSSEDEASDSEVTVSFDKEHYAVDFDGRLDELQQLSVQDLQSILLGEADSFSRQDESQIAPTIQASTIEAEVTAASQHTVSEVQAPIQESSILDAEVNITSSQDVTMAEVENPPQLLDGSIPQEQNNALSTISFSREKFSQLQNKSRNWSSTVENNAWPDFQREMKVKKVYNNRSQPLQYFIDFFTEGLMDIIVINTNIYANHTNAKSWTDITNEELKAFFGLVILMSINPLHDINMYWSTDEFYNNPVISKVMPIRRFKKINQNLHISNITTETPRNSPGYDKLAKIRPAIEVLNKTFKENVEASQFNSIDESMIRFKGRSHMKQYMPKKPIKRGYKCWARADSYTGYLYEFQFYTGKIDSGTEENLGARVVMDLCESVPHGTLVAFDNFFTSLPLMEILSEKDIHSVGTIRQNRKGLPDLLTGKNLSRETKKETTLKPGEFMYQFDAPVSIVKWKDTKDVFVASTAFDPRIVEIIERKQKDGSKKKMYCPLAIKKYTEFMGGVDHFDHFRASYPIGRKSRKNWHRIFWFLLEAATINAYIVYMASHSARRNTHKEFRLRLGRALINNFSSRKCVAPVFKTKKGGANAVPDEVRKVDVGSHMPELTKFRRCRMCSTRAKEKRTKYVCKVCKVPLCAAPCFYNFHNAE